MTQKECYACKIPKLLTEFHDNKAKPDGKHGTCKSCRSDKSKTIYHPQNRDKRNEHYHSNKRYYQSRALQSRLGVTLDDYDEMLEVQNGLCAICNESHTNFIRRFAVDHDHKTGKIRALLCINCNIGLGKFKDNPNLLNSAIKYLSLHS